MKSLLFKAVAVSWMLAVAACVTVNIYFPAEEVNRTAEKIVDDVYHQVEADQAPQNRQGHKQKAEKSSSSLCFPLSWFAPPSAMAQDPTSVSNAGIRGLKEEIARNLKRLAPYLSAGNVGIGKDGYLMLLSEAGLSLKRKAELRRLVEADNKARRSLYKEVARAMNIDSNQVERIAVIFGKQWRDKALAGWWIQSDSGGWEKK